jgi:hypothetical protein
MDEQELTQSFNNYIEPSSIPFRFGAPGWWVLASLLLIILLLISFLIVRHYCRNVYRRQALKWLDQIIQSNHSSPVLQQQVYEAAILIKRVAMALYGRNPVAGLSGEAWINWLNSRIKKRSVPAFDQSDACLVSDGIYGSRELDPAIVHTFFEKAKYWIRYHHAI